MHFSSRQTRENAQRGGSGVLSVEYIKGELHVGSLFFFVFYPLSKSHTFIVTMGITRLKGKALMRASTAMAGVGFLLFGYDQVNDLVASQKVIYCS